MADNSLDSLVSVAEAAEILEVKGDEIELLERLSEIHSGRNSNQLNIFILCTAMILLSDTTLRQKSELLIFLFDTNQNFIIGYDEMHMLFRCCLLAIARMVKSYADIKTNTLEKKLDEFKRRSRYAREEGISVNDFTQFLLNTPDILMFLNHFGLFL